MHAPHAGKLFHFCVQVVTGRVLDVAGDQGVGAEKGGDVV